MLGFPKETIPDITFLTAKLDIAPVARLRVHDWQDGEYWLCSADQSPGLINADHFYQDDQWIMLFDGDLVNHPKIPWAHFRELMDSENFEQFSELVGIWAFAAINTQSGIIYLVSDHISQYPCFYSVKNKLLSFSTELHTFCRLSEKATFNQAWLYDSLYLQYPVSDKTFLNNVYRLPAASVLKFERHTSKLSIVKYRKDFQQAPRLKTGKEALAYAYEVFDAQLPKYPPTDREWAIGLTAGFDARTVLAFTVESEPLTYTYGIPGCSDITIASDAAKQLGLRHKTIPFDDTMDELFKDLMLDVVYLSGGLENSSRAELLYSYRAVTENATRFPMVASGIGLDSIFRGHLGPALVSSALAEHFLGKPEAGTPRILDDIVLDKQAFYVNCEAAIEYLKSRYGPLTQSLTHLLYFIYEAAPKYFGGEVSIARNFTTLRIPALNPHILELAFSIDKSALSFSNFLPTHTRDSFSEKELQAFLLRKASGERMGSLPVYDVPPNISRYGENAANMMQKWASLKRMISRVIFDTGKPPALQQNLKLYQTVARERVRELLYSSDTLVSEYIDIPEFNVLVSSKHKHLFKVLLTTETIMRLIENRWRRFW